MCRTIIKTGFAIAILCGVFLLTHQPGRTPSSTPVVDRTPSPSTLIESVEPDLSELDVDDAEGVQPESTPPQPADMNDLYRSIAVAYQSRDEKAGTLVLEALTGRPGLADDLLLLMLEEDLPQEEFSGIFLVVKAALTMNLQGIEPGVAALESLDVFEELLIAAALESESSWSPVHDLLFTEGLISADSLDVVLAHLVPGENRTSSQRHTAAQLLARSMELAAAADPNRLDELLESDDGQVRTIAYDILLERDRDRTTDFAERMASGPKEDASALFATLCRHVEVDDLPGLLLDATSSPNSGGIHYEWGLATYLERAGHADYDDIIHLRGSGPDSSGYRRASLVAINYHNHDGGAEEDLLESVIKVYELDPDPMVRGTALLTLSLQWDPSDEEGFERIVERSATNPNLSMHVRKARSNFAGRTDKARSQ